MRRLAAQGLAAVRSGAPTAMVAVLATEGSAPRGAGTRMFVTQGGAMGTIGGGNLEFQAIRQARAILGQAAGAWRVQDYPLGPLLGQCCGGRVRLLVEHLDPHGSDWLAALSDGARGELAMRFGEGEIERTIVARASGTAATARGPMPQPGDSLVEPAGEIATPLALFGAGHVGQALARLLADLPFGLEWCDNRPDLAGAEGLAVIDADAMVERARIASGAVLILTHDHALDYRLTAAALESPAAFVGLIGSATKRARFLSRLRKQGLEEVHLARLVCPIGAPGITGKDPAVIAIAVAAQLLMLFPAP